MAIAEAGQAVLRERYVASVWADRMYEFLSGVCSVEAVVSNLRSIQEKT
jgi:hypothetical protein